MLNTLRTRVRSDDSVAQLVLGTIRLERLPEHGQQTSKEPSESRVEDKVEQQNFR